MTKTRWIAVAAAVAVLAVGGVAYGVAAGGEGTAASTSTTTSTVRPVTTTTEAPTTTSSTTSTTSTIPLDDGVLQRGDKGPAVAALQRRLTELHLDPGPADGAFGLATFYAVEGFQKLAGMGADGRVGPEVAAALANPPAVTPLVPNGGATRVEVDLKRQLLFLYKDGKIRLISHVSTGSGKKYCVAGDCNNTAITPVGSFRFAWRYRGWRESRLGKLYNPVYFTSSGVAVHGALSVPTYPASHGCVRIPMHIAEYFPSLVDRGDPVYVTDGRPVGPPSTVPTGPPPTDPPTTPGDDTPPPSTTTTTQPPSTTTTSTTPTTLIP
jgi:peptidoglycan hydrolase-like protein with peptidoglycan-binding domain